MWQTLTDTCFTVLLRGAHEVRFIVSAFQGNRGRAKVNVSQGTKPVSDAHPSTSPLCDSAGFLCCLVQNPQQTFNFWLLPTSAASSGASLLRRCQDSAARPGALYPECHCLHFAPPVRPSPAPCRDLQARRAFQHPARWPPLPATLRHRVPPPSRYPSATLTSICDCWWLSASLTAPSPRRSGSHAFCPQLTPHTRQENLGISSLFRTLEESRWLNWQALFEKHYNRDFM